jgi:hypothetical protein
MRRVRLLVASKGNEVMLDIASLIADGLTAHEVDTAIVIDELPPPATDDFVLVIAPHEFFPLFVEPLHGGNKRLDSLLPEVNVLNVEQPGSQWFELAWHYARRSRGLFDISSEGVREFARRGRVAAHLPLGFASSLMGPALLAGDRPIDVLFMGYLSVRREMRVHSAVTDAKSCSATSRRRARQTQRGITRGVPGWSSSQPARSF